MMSTSLDFPAFSPPKPRNLRALLFTNVSGALHFRKDDGLRLQVRLHRTGNSAKALGQHMIETSSGTLDLTDITSRLSQAQVIEKSRLAALPVAVWEQVASVTGVNAELSCQSSA